MLNGIGIDINSNEYNMTYYNFSRQKERPGGFMLTWESRGSWIALLPEMAYFSLLNFALFHHEPHLSIACFISMLEYKNCPLELTWRLW